VIQSIQSPKIAGLVRAFRNPVKALRYQPFPQFMVIQHSNNLRPDRRGLQWRKNCAVVVLHQFSIAG
jgi:hypothetical protein